jgi:hypothetical protein
MAVSICFREFGPPAPNEDCFYSVQPIGASSAAVDHYDSDLPVDTYRGEILN